MNKAPLQGSSRSGAFAFGWDAGLAALCVALLAHQQVVCNHNGFALLVNDVEMLGHDALVGMLLMVFLIANGDYRMNGVADIDRFDKAQVVIAIREGNGVDKRGGEANAHAECQRAVGDTLTKVVLLAPIGVYVVRKEVARLAGVNHDVGLGDGLAARGTGVSQLIVLKIVRLLVHDRLLFLSNVLIGILSYGWCRGSTLGTLSVDDDGAACGMNLGAVASLDYLNHMKTVKCFGRHEFFPCVDV